MKSVVFVIANLISIKQLIAYSYFYLRAPYSLIWHKILARL